MLFFIQGDELNTKQKLPYPPECFILLNNIPIKIKKASDLPNFFMKV